MKRVAFLLIPAVLLAGCSGGIVKNKVESGIENALKEYIGPAKEYRVDAGGSELSMVNGLIKRLHIEGDDVKFDPDLNVSRMVVDMEQVRYEPSTRKLTSVDSTTFSATITEDAINKYIAANQNPETDLSVELEKNEVTVEFVPEVVGIDILIRVKGKPQIVKGDKVNFVADEGSIAHLPVPGGLVKKALDRMNPILDLSTMRFPVNLTSIEVKRNNALIKGNAVIKQSETSAKPK